MPRATDEGVNTAFSQFDRKCPVCEKVFKVENPRTKYCSLKCKKSSNNRKYYISKK